MARTTAAAVKLILGDFPKTYQYDGVSDLTPFIDTASAIVDRLKVCADKKVTQGKLDTTLSDAELELIERWLAAHCYCQMDQPLSSKSTAGASGSFQGQTALHLESTRYGQMAMKLDFSGCLSRQKARTVWLGKPPSEQVAYVDRE